MTAPPSWRARGLKRLQNQLHHRGIMVDLNTSDECVEALRQRMKDDDELAEKAVKMADLSAAAKFRGLAQKTNECLERVLKERERAGGGDDEDPEAVETKAKAFLESRGWRCTR